MVDTKFIECVLISSVFSLIVLYYYQNKQTNNNKTNNSRSKLILDN